MKYIEVKMYVMYYAKGVGITVTISFINFVYLLTHETPV